MLPRSHACCDADELETGASQEVGRPYVEKACCCVLFSARLWCGVRIQIASIQQTWPVQCSTVQCGVGPGAVAVAVARAAALAAAVAGAGAVHYNGV